MHLLLCVTVLWFHSDLKFVDEAFDEMFMSDRKSNTDSLAFFVSVNKFLSISIVVATVAQALACIWAMGFKQYMDFLE